MNLARFLVSLGAITVFSGVTAVAGYGWGLIVLGLAVVAYGLALVDIGDAADSSSDGPHP
jgi:hypothetical protein